MSKVKKIREKGGLLHIEYMSGDIYSYRFQNGDWVEDELILPASMSKSTPRAMAPDEEEQVARYEEDELDRETPRNEQISESTKSRLQILAGIQK
jgi:hypothetical protein